MKARKNHSKIRCQERYNINCSNKDLKNLEQKIRSGKSIFIRRISNSKTVRLVDDYKVVYSSATKQICTFLERNMK